MQGGVFSRRCMHSNVLINAVQDLDIDFKLVLNASTYDRLMDQIEEDCALLEALRVMDYSMLLGVHFLAWGPDEWHPPKIKVQSDANSCLLHYMLHSMTARAALSLLETCHKLTCMYARPAVLS